MSRFQYFNIIVTFKQNHRKAQFSMQTIETDVYMLKNTINNCVVYYYALKILNINLTHT